MADAIAKFWVMPRTGTALLPVDSTSAGVTATKGAPLHEPERRQAPP